MPIQVSLLTQETIDAYHINKIAADGYIYIGINKGIYGLPQAGLLAKRLAKFGYYQHCLMRYMPGGPRVCTPCVYSPPPCVVFTPPTPTIFLAQLVLSLVVDYAHG